LIPALLVLAAAAALPADCQVASWCIKDNCPRFLALLFGEAQPFGHGIGVLVILLLLFHLDPGRRPMLPRVAAMSWGAGMAANMIKMTVARTRPHNFDFEGGVVDTFGGWLPFLSGGSGGQSFPSAHTATAVGLAFALAWLYPRGRGVFAGLAVLVACQRVEGGAHYPSDTLCGAAVGWLVAVVCLKSAPVAGGFDRLEDRLRTRLAQPREAGASRHASGGEGPQPGRAEEPSRAA
jgi:membrane-associated phospholipid phosphatase